MFNRHSNFHKYKSSNLENKHYSKQTSLVEFVFDSLNKQNINLDH